MTKKAKESLVSLVEDEQGFWTKPVVKQPLPPATEFGVKVVKFFAPTRTCPIHGETRVLDRNIQAAMMHTVEGLECGHTLLITRDVSGLKPIKERVEGTLKLVPIEPLAYPRITRTIYNNPRMWDFRSWRLNFLDTIRAKEIDRLVANHEEAQALLAR